MSALGLVSGDARTPSPPLSLPADVQVRLEDVLASSRRLWLRGRVALVNTPFAVDLTRQFRDWEKSVKGWQHVYYLACVPPGSENRAAEMALASTALGWPPGTFVLLPADPGNARAALDHGLARLRWMFEGELE